jgi:uncharacterized small protein (DUF1192 family)
MSELNTQRLLKIQVAVAVLAVGATAFSLYELGPLTQRQAELKADIESLQAKRAELQRDNATLAGAAKPADNSSGSKITAWLYLGRAADGHWAPASDSVAPAPNPELVQGFSAVVARRNATLVGTIEDEPISPKSSSGPVQLVKSGTELNVEELKTQPSIGGASLVWAKVSVPPDKVLELSGK